MSGIVFEPDSARRIAAATRGYEQSLSAPEPVTYEADNSYGRMMLVRTDPSFPTNYSGDMAAGAAIIEKRADGTVKVITTVWLKDLNNALLKPSTIYQARLSGTYTQEVIVNGIPTLKTFALYLVQQAITPKEEHYYPKLVTLNDYYSFGFPGDPVKYFRIEPAYNSWSIIGTYGFRQISNIVYNSNTFGPVQPILKVRYSGPAQLSDKNRYAYYEWYSDPIWVTAPVQISGGKAVRYNTPVADYGGIAYAGGDGDYLCQWQLMNIYSQLNSYSGFLDYIIPISKQTKPTIAGIGSGIGSGISGV
jgi:hypothetical protein